MDDSIQLIQDNKELKGLIVCASQEIVNLEQFMASKKFHCGRALDNLVPIEDVQKYVEHIKRTLEFAKSV